jgi:hypothetical protein
MKLLFTLSIAIYCFCLANITAAEFSSAPLEKIRGEEFKVMFEATALNNWLNQNYVKLHENQIQGAREHLHSLIDARIKHLFAKNNTLSIKEPDLTLAILYSWAGRLGVYGADLVFQSQKGSYTAKPYQSLIPPYDIEIALIDNALSISSQIGAWRATVPYYFFVFGVSSGAGTFSAHSEAVVISTGTADIKSPPGYSQSTIALFYLKNPVSKDFEVGWFKALQIPPNIMLKKIDNTNYMSRYAYDSGAQLHKEIILLPSKEGVLTILYSGLDGAYQLNRPHFLDFLRLLQPPK